MRPRKLPARPLTSEDIESLLWERGRIDVDAPHIERWSTIRRRADAESGRPAQAARHATNAALLVVEPQLRSEPQLWAILEAATGLADWHSREQWTSDDRSKQTHVRDNAVLGRRRIEDLSRKVVDAACAWAAHPKHFETLAAVVSAIDERDHGSRLFEVRVAQLLGHRLAHAGINISAKQRVAALYVGLREQLPTSTQQ